MNVKLLYFARLRETFGVSGEDFVLSADTATVADLVGQLRARSDIWATELAEGRAWRVAVNQDIAGPDTALAHGDEVAIFPPVTGG